MYKLIPIIFLFSCSTLQYPITTRYKEKRIKQEWIVVKDTKPKYKPVPKKKMDYDVLIFVVGTILGYKLML